MRLRRKFFSLLAVAGCVAEALAPAAAAQEKNTVHYDIPAQSLEGALSQFAIQSKRQVIYDPGVVPNRDVTELKGEYEPEKALQMLLKDSGLEARITRGDTIVVTAAGRTAISETSGDRQFNLTQADIPAGGEEAATGMQPRRVERRESRIEFEEILVTGTYIRGAKDVAAPSTVITREEIDRTGYTTVEQLLENLPQNFASTHPASASGATNAPRLAAISAGARSTGVDLRGLGADSTLVMVNGKRRAAIGSDGRFVDISTIPLAAIERVEIVTGGGSALYGSDAVAGTVNYILRRDFQGAQTQVSYGAPTGYDGGERLQVSQILGYDFGRGSLVAAYDYREDRASNFLDLGQVPDEQLSSGQTYRFFPFHLPIERHSALLSGKFDLSDGSQLYGDVLYTRKKTTVFSSYRLTNLSPVPQNESFFLTEGSVEEYSATLGVKVALGAGWSADLSGLYSRASSPLDVTTSLDRGSSGLFQQEAVDRATTLTTFSAVADGPLMQLGSVTSRAALGVEVRKDTLERIQHVRNTSLPAGTVSGFDRSYDPDRDVRSAFVETRVPFVENGAAGLRRIELTLGVRYDDYSDVGDAVNWSAGTIWQVNEALTLRGTYATSIHAPAFIDTEALSLGAANLRATLDPARGPGVSSPVLFEMGTGPVVPEEARSWTVTADFTPQFAPWAKLSLSYVSIDYDKRINTPMTALEQSLALQREERYPGLIDRAPTVATLTEIFARDIDGIIAGSGSFPAWNPATGPAGLLAALPNLIVVDTRATNLAVDTYRGIDLGLDTHFDTDAGQLSFGVNAMYMLERDGAVTETSPVFSAMNEVGRPADLKLRGNAGWTRGPWGAFLYVNHVDSYPNRFSVPVSTVASWTTADVTLRFSGGVPAAAWLGDFDASLNVLNALDRDPPALLGSPVLTYDPTNANPTGRYVTLNLAKRW